MHTPETRARAYEKVRQRKSDWFSENGPCVRCQSWDNLELDHINPEEKVSHRIWSWSDERRKAETDKCQALCNSCHKEKTKEYWESIAQHGTVTMYKYYRCRCEPCRDAKREEKRKYG